MSQLTLKQKKQMYAKAQVDPCWWLEQVVGVKTLTWSSHREILEAFLTNDRIAVKSGHSMGKDFISGMLTLWFLYCHRPAVVITTAPTARQVEKIVWGEISKYWKKHLGGVIHTKSIDIASDWYAIGFTTKETNQMVGKFQGFKGKNILVVVTEAQAVEDNVYEQIEGVLTAPCSKLYLAGNPLRSEGTFYKAFQDARFKTFTFSCYESPNYLANKEVIPGMVGRAWVEDKEKQWGKTSPLFQGRVLGEFPTQSINSLISPQAVKKSVSNTPKKGYKVLGIDVARFGDDSIVYSLFEGGKQIAQEVEQGKPTTQTEGKAINMIVNYKPDYVIIDEGAMGAGVVDHLWEDKDKIKRMVDKNNVPVGEFDIYAFNFGSKPNNDHFADKGTEAYFQACQAIESGKVQLMYDEELFAQLYSRRYIFTSRGRMKLESKADHKKRGLDSPDKADATVMALYLSLEDTYDETMEDGMPDYSHLEARIDPLTGYIDKNETYVGGTG